MMASEKEAEKRNAPSGLGSVTDAFEQLRAGDRAAADKLFERFFPRLLGLARKTLSSRRTRGSDAEDAAQNAFVSFWQQTEQGNLVGDLHRNDLWKLLAAITVHKALKMHRDERRQKRGGPRGAASLDEVADIEASLAQVRPAEFELYCEELLLQLDDELRGYALLRLLGYKNNEIAKLFECSERTVELKLAQIRRQWSKE